MQQVDFVRETSVKGSFLDMECLGQILHGCTLDAVTGKSLRSFDDDLFFRIMSHVSSVFVGTRTKIAIDIGNLFVLRGIVFVKTET